MDATALSSKVEQLLSGKLLQKTRFGRTGAFCFWVEAKDLSRISSTLRSDPDIQLDRLENLSVMQMEDALVVSYFIGSNHHPESVLLRATLELQGPDEQVSAPSVKEQWPMAEPFESENATLFGIRFGEMEVKNEWDGFPLRKSFDLARARGGHA